MKQSFDVLVVHLMKIKFILVGTDSFKWFHKLPSCVASYQRIGLISLLIF